jgi:hypothetical protein
MYTLKKKKKNLNSGSLLSHPATHTISFHPEEERREKQREREGKEGN